MIGAIASWNLQAATIAAAFNNPQASKALALVSLLTVALEFRIELSWMLNTYANCLLVCVQAIAKVFSQGANAQSLAVAQASLCCVCTIPKTQLK